MTLTQACSRLLDQTAESRLDIDNALYGAMMSNPHEDVQASVSDATLPAAAASDRRHGAIPPFFPRRLRHDAARQCRRLDATGTTSARLVMTLGQ